MTLSLSKLMASDKPLTDDERKRLLAIAKAATAARTEMAALVVNPDATDKFSWPAENIADGECLQNAYDTPRASLEGVEL